MNSRTPAQSFAWIAALAATAALMLVLPAASIAGSSARSGPVNTAAPVVTGAPVQDSTLTASTGVWSGGVFFYGYEWQRCSSSGCAPIAGASGSRYTLVAADVGNSIRVVVTAFNKRGWSSAPSASVGPVAPAPVSAPKVIIPVVVTAPTISGTPQDGQTLSASTGTWSNSPTSFAYQWSFCSSDGSCSPFSSGNGLATYTLSLVDVGRTVKVTVTASNTAGSTSSTSAPTAVVAPKPAPAPLVTVAIPSPTAGATISGNVYFTATVALPRRSSPTGRACRPASPPTCRTPRPLRPECISAPACSCSGTATRGSCPPRRATTATAWSSSATETTRTRPRSRRRRRSPTRAASTCSTVRAPTRA